MKRFALLSGFAMVVAAAVFAGTVNAPVGPATAQAEPAVDDRRSVRVQYGADFLSTSVMEHPFLNRVRSSSGYWTARSGEKNAALVSGGHIDPITGLPVSTPAGGGAMTVGYWMVGADAYPEYFSGEYVAEWEGDASIEIYDVPAALKRRDGRNRLVFRQDKKAIKPVYLAFKDVKDDGLKDLRIYRAEDEAAVKAGELWSPTFLEFASRWDVIRTMDWQSTNNSPVRSWDDLATMESAHWGNGHRSQWPPAHYYSIPYEVLFNLGVETGSEIWVHVPVEIGSPKHHSHPDFAKDGKTPKDHAYEDAYKIRAFVRENALKILASPEWDRYAENFLNALDASGYPAERPLYVEVGNEIWNYGGGFIFSSWYAWAIAEGLLDADILEKAGDASFGSGVLNARWQIALEAAQARRETRYNIVYVAASHTALPARTSWMLGAQNDYLDHAGADAAAMFAKTKLAVTNYWGAANSMGRDIIGDYRNNGSGLVAAWEAKIRDDRPAAMALLRDRFLDPKVGCDNRIGVVGWIVGCWRDHQRRAAAFGVDLLGAYEGGPSLEVQGHSAPLRKSEAFMALWRDFIWGPDGARVTQAVNDALIDAFPGVLLSKFQMVGAIGNPDDPWSAGHYSDKTDQWRAWEAYMKPAP